MARADTGIKGFSWLEMFRGGPGSLRAEVWPTGPIGGSVPKPEQRTAVGAGASAQKIAQYECGNEIEREKPSLRVTDLILPVFGDRAKPRSVGEGDTLRHVRITVAHCFLWLEGKEALGRVKD